MGMGEPLANYKNVIPAVQLLLDDYAFGLSRRRVTISTAGLVPQMRRLADDCNVALAVSLHAPDDALRDELVPINRKWPVAEVIAAGRRFAARTRRRVSLEYVMIDGLNDTDAQAERLADLMRGWRTHLNLIPLNPTPGSAWSGTSMPAIERFATRIRATGATVTIRDTRGREIDAACGQLHAQLAGRSLPAAGAAPPPMAEAARR
jgi:23S rRNA (adenine2503-C2)-methyltransferase